MRIDVIEAISENPYFRRNNVLSDAQNEAELIKALKMFMKHNPGAFELIDAKWFAFLKNDYIKLKAHAGAGTAIFPEMKNFIWKLNRYWVCRRCKEYGAIDVDWKTITVEYCRYLPKNEYNAIREWEKKFESFKDSYTRRQICEITGCETRAGIFGSMYCAACHEPVKKEIEKIAGMKVFEK